MAVPLTGKVETLDLKSLELSIPEGERRLLMTSSCLFSAEYVEVINPQRQDGFCSIYGEISFSNGTPESLVTLFKRSQDDPETIDLGDPNFRFLTLSDDGVRAPPFIYYGYPVHFILKLYEKKHPRSQDEEDRKQPESSSCQKPKVLEEDPKEKEEITPIADIDFTFNDCYGFNKRFILEFDGESGFVFSVAYAFLLNCIPVGVRFTIKDAPEEGQGLSNTSDAIAEEGQGQVLSSTSEGHEQGNLTRKRNHPFCTAIYGVIAAIQHVKNPPSPAIQLFYRSEDEYEEVDFGSPIHLDRTFLVCPVSFGFLYIGYTLFSAKNDTVIATGIVPFPINARGFGGTHFWVDKNLTHTRDSEDGRVSVSLKFMTPNEAIDPSGRPTDMKPIPDYDKF